MTYDQLINKNLGLETVRSGEFFPQDRWEDESRSDLSSSRDATAIKMP